MVSQIITIVVSVLLTALIGAIGYFGKRHFEKKDEREKQKVESLTTLQKAIVDLNAEMKKNNDNLNAEIKKNNEGTMVAMKSALNEYYCKMIDNKFVITQADYEHWCKDFERYTALGGNSDIELKHEIITAKYRKGVADGSALKWSF